MKAAIILSAALLSDAALFAELPQPLRLAGAPVRTYREDRVTEFYFDGGRGPKNVVLLELGPMGAPMAALHKCADDLVASWGLNPEEQKRLRQRPTPKTSPARWLTSSDYPTMAAFAGQRAIVNFRLAVDEAGKATNCHIQSAIGGPDFERAVCAASSWSASHSNRRSMPTSTP